jgi:hypothetical protein
MSTLLRLAGLVLFTLAALAGLGVIDTWSIRTILGLVAAGAACVTAAGFSYPALPAGR